ncbi:MAG: pseudouridine synthase [Clostridium sp.]
MVINKAANVPIHPSQGNFSNSLANGLAWYFKQKQNPLFSSAINRLDRDTTGLLIVAKMR